MFSLAVLNISQCRHCIVSILSTRDAKSYIINGHWGRGYMPYCRHHILNILLSEVLSSAFNPSLLVWISLSFASITQPIFVTPAKSFHRVSFDCPYSITSNAEVHFFQFPLRFCAASRFFHLELYLVQVINSSNLYSTFFTSPTSICDSAFNCVSSPSPLRLLILIIFPSQSQTTLLKLYIQQQFPLPTFASTWWNYKQQI